MTLERESSPFSADDLLWLEAFAALTAPILEQRQAAERGALRRLGKEAKTPW